jgi:cytosine/adenosine deaminase-related metal-dependent hydrolase
MAVTVVAGDAVVTADPERRILEPSWVAFEDGMIVSVGGGPPPAEPSVRGGLILPGLVSAHQHLVDALVRGGPIGPAFLDWLLGTYHAGLAHARPDECAAAIASVRAMGLATGVTTVVDCWSVGPVDDPHRVDACADASIAAHLASGGRTVFAPMFCEIVPDGWAGEWGIDPGRLCRPFDESLAWVEALASRWAEQEGRLTITPSPELPETSTAEGLQAAYRLARRLGAVLPIHLCASPPSRAAFGPDDAAELGILGPGLLAAHCSAVEEHDVAVLGAAHVGVAHCPSASIAMGADVFTPLARLRAAGATGGLGLDNASLHWGGDLFEEARRAGDVAARTGAPLDAVTLLDLITIEGATAAGLGASVGSLEVGKRADLVVLDTSGAHWARGDDWPAAIIGCARASDVHAVFVDGQQLRPDAAPHAAELAAAQARIRALMPW